MSSTAPSSEPGIPEANRDKEPHSFQGYFNMLLADLKKLRQQPPAKQP